MAKKTQATDTEVGVIHKKINTIIDKTADSILQKLDDGADPLVVVNMKDIQVMQRWCEINDVKAVLEIDSEGNATKAKLEAIRQKASGKISKLDDFRKEG